MSECYENQKKISSHFRKFLQERIEKANPRRELTAEETKRLNKLEGIADKLKRGKKRAKWIVSYTQVTHALWSGRK